MRLITKSLWKDMGDADRENKNVLFSESLGSYKSIRWDEECLLFYRRHSLIQTEKQMHRYLRWSHGEKNQAWPHGTHCLITQTYIKISSLKINTFIMIKMKKKSVISVTNMELDKNWKVTRGPELGKEKWFFCSFYTLLYCLKLL